MSDRNEAALTQLRGILLVVNRARSKPTPEQVEAISKMTNDAISVLQEPDRIKQRLGFVVLALRESVQLKHPVIRGKRMTRVHILDQQLYHWALEKLMSEDYWK